MSSNLIVIPCRMHATRLPGKPLADIAGEAMVVHIVRLAKAADAGPVLVATDSQDILDTVVAAGGEAVLTRPDHPSGSDRVREAITTHPMAASADIIVNLQGDLPTLDPSLINTCIAPLNASPEPDIGTLCAQITDTHEIDNPNVVKVVGTPLPTPGHMRALYFTRATAPHGPGPLYHHIGIYAYRRAALDRFVELPPSPLEKRERLEQLRALESGMRIDLAIVDTVPLGVDTPEDLERARAILQANNT